MDAVIKSTKYLSFTELPNEGKTRLIQIDSQRADIKLGEIRWYAPWRQYVFYPERQTVFNHACLEDIQLVIMELNSWQRQRRFNG